MTKMTRFVFWGGMMLLLFVACSVEGKTAVNETQTNHIFQSVASRYQLTYPPSYCWTPGKVETVNSFVNIPAEDSALNLCPSEQLLLHGPVVWLTVHVEPANSRSLAEAVDVFTMGLDDFGLEMEEVEIGAETAVQINNMPGQEISRELLLIHNDQLYRLSFVPAGADDGERLAEMERLYEMIVGSFQFK